MTKIIDLSGKIYGRLTVVEFSKRENKATFWKCQCECGTVRDFRAGDLRKGVSNSCGCLQRELLSQNKPSESHGLSMTGEYSSWAAMIHRCKKENLETYRNYADRGIQIFERWLGPEGIYNFVQDMGFRPFGTSLDRIDNNGSYCPENCRWATSKEQNSNKRNNVYLTLKGEIKTVAEWGRVLNLRPRTIRLRISRGWSIEDALTKPIKKVKKKE